MTLRIGITGSNGQLGLCLMDLCQQDDDIHIVPFTRDHIDLNTNLSVDAVHTMIQREQCDVFINTAAYTSEILRGGLMSIPGGLVEAAQACGMSRLLCFRRITFSLAIRQALPAYGNELVLVVKGTSLASTITVLEITGHAKRLMSQTYAILEIFAIAGMLYLLINLVLITLIRTLEACLTRYMSR